MSYKNLKETQPNKASASTTSCSITDESFDSTGCRFLCKRRATVANVEAVSAPTPMFLSSVSLWVCYARSMHTSRRQLRGLLVVRQKTRSLLSDGMKVKVPPAVASPSDVFHAGV